jgi:hypothetical protein
MSSQPEPKFLDFKYTSRPDRKIPAYYECSLCLFLIDNVHGCNANLKCVRQDGILTGFGSIYDDARWIKYVDNVMPNSLKIDMTLCDRCITKFIRDGFFTKYAEFDDCYGTYSELCNTPEEWAEAKRIVNDKYMKERISAGENIHLTHIEEWSD